MAVADNGVIQLLQSNAKLNSSNKRDSKHNIMNKAMSFSPNENYIHTLHRSKRFVDPFSLFGFFSDIYSIIDGIESDRESEENFKKVFDGINRNYNAINKNYQAIKNVEEKVDRNHVVLKQVSEMVNETLSAVEKSRVEMHQGFNFVLQSLRNLEIKPTISKLNIIIKDFLKEKERIKKLPQNQYITKLEEENGILVQLKDYRSTKTDSLHVLLYNIINQGHAIPQGANDEVGFTALHALYYGTQTYVTVMFFLLEQYSYLASYHYQNGGIEEYNKYFDLIQTSFQDFKHSLVGNVSSDELNKFQDFKHSLVDSSNYESNKCQSYKHSLVDESNKCQSFKHSLVGIGNKTLIDNVIDILCTVQMKDFIKDTRRFSSSLLSEKIESLTLIKHTIGKMKLPIIEDVPIKVTGRPKFKKYGISTPIGEWKDGAKVSYAVQYRNNNIYSKVGEWSDPLRVSGNANPFLRIPVDPKRRTRLVFRKFNNDRPQLVGVLENKYRTRFRDINRDLYNAALRFNNEDIAINEVDILIHNGADVNEVFDIGRRAIHAAAQSNSMQLAQDFLINNNTTDINIKDNNGYTPMHIAAEAGHDKFIELLIKYGADVNAKSDTNELTPLHIATYRGYDSTVKTLMQSNAIDVNAKDKESFVPLHSAIFGGVPVVQALMSNNSTDINVKSKMGLTPLHLLSINNYLDITEILLESGMVDINARAEGNLTALHFASMIGNLEIVQVLTAQNETDVNAESVNSWTPLHFAVSLKKDSVVSELLKINDTNVNIAGEGNITPLHIAAATGQEGVVLGLLEKQAAIEELTKDGLTALHLASMHGFQGVVSSLIDNGANIDVTALNGSTPLHLAAQNGYLELVKYLIDEKGANFKIENNDKRTPLHVTTQLDIVKYFIEEKQAVNWGLGMITTFLAYEDRSYTYSKERYDDLLYEAAMYGKLGVVKYLIDKGANIHKKYIVNDETPLLEAAESGHLDIVKYLTEKGANVHVKNKWGSTPLHEAARWGHLDIVKYLTERGVNIHGKDERGRTPLFASAAGGYLDIARYFIERGATNSREDINGNTPLHMAAFWGKLDLIKCLMEDKEADVDAKNNDGRTPLHNAALSKDGNGKLDLVKYLLDKGASLHEKDNYGHTLLHQAANCFYVGLMECDQDLPVIKYLVEDKGANADINVKDNDGYTPLYLPVKYGILNVVKYLIEKGADVNVRDNYGNTLLEIANQRSYRFHVAEYLKSKGAHRSRRSIEFKELLKDIEVSNYDNTSTSVSDDLSESHKIVYKRDNKNQATSGASKPCSRINVFANPMIDAFKDVSQFISSSIKPAIDMKYSKVGNTSKILPEIKTISAQSDINGGILLADVLLAKKGRRQIYTLSVNKQISSLEAQAHTLNIVNEFESILKQAAFRCGISVQQLKVNYQEIQSSILIKIMAVDYYGASRVLYLAAEKACPALEQKKKFLWSLKSKIEHILQKEMLPLLNKTNGNSSFLRRSINKAVDLPGPRANLHNKSIASNSTELIR